MLTSLCAWLVSLSPWVKRKLWKFCYQILAGQYPKSDWTFMNFGYAEIDPGVPDLLLQEADRLDRLSIQLYHQVATAAADGLDGLKVLEIGCGRGGGCSYVSRYLSPQAVLGIDFSEKAVSLCRQFHSCPGLSFQQGDAEALPVEDSAFDVVINVESSHCYGSMERFLGEVTRVLKPGGYFLWADMRPGDHLDAMRQQFIEGGLELRKERCITPNVLRSLELMDARKRTMIARAVPRLFRRGFGDFAGVAGSRLYEALRTGTVEYLCCALQKPAG